MENKNQMDIEQYIKENLQAFDEEPFDGNYKRFLERQKMMKRRKMILFIVPSASAALIVILLSINLFMPHTKPISNGIIACEKTNGMKSCYLNKMNAMAEHINSLTQNMDKWNRQLVQDEVSNIITYAKDIDSMVPDELPEKESKHLLADCYKQSLEGLETIIQLINENNNSQKQI